MTAWWQRYEGPTWLVAVAIYGGWIALAAWHRQLTPWIAIPLAVYVTAWHSSLQHETIHALRRVPRPLRTLLAFPPLGVWFPFELYRRDHLRHHAVRELTGPQDPESFYVGPEAWRSMPAALRALYVVNQTLCGRLLVGPALLIGRAYGCEIRRLVAGDLAHLPIWTRHVGATAVLLGLLQACTGLPPLAYLVVIAYPAASLGLVRSFAEHRAAEIAAQRTATVVSRSALSLLFLNNNYHATHHAYPALPWYELPTRWHSREPSARRFELVYTGGYRSIVLGWLVRPIHSPVRPPATLGARSA